MSTTNLLLTSRCYLLIIVLLSTTIYFLSSYQKNDLNIISANIEIEHEDSLTISGYNFVKTSMFHPINWIYVEKPGVHGKNKVKRIDPLYNPDKFK